MAKQPPAPAKKGRVQINVSVAEDDDFLEQLDQWRAHQKDLPPRPTAVLRLAKEALTWSRGKARRG